MSDAIRSTIELNIYNDELEIVKSYKTYGIRWKAFKKIMSMQDELDALKDAEDDEAVDEIGNVLKLIYPNITDEDLEEAYTDDLFDCFGQALKNNATAIPLASDGGLRSQKWMDYGILSSWEHGNQKTGTNIWYSTISYSSASTGKSCLYQSIYQMISSSFHTRYAKDTK